MNQAGLFKTKSPVSYLLKFLQLLTTIPYKQTKPIGKMEFIPVAWLARLSISLVNSCLSINMAVEAREKLNGNIGGIIFMASMSVQSVFFLCYSIFAYQSRGIAELVRDVMEVSGRVNAELKRPCCSIACTLAILCVIVFFVSTFSKVVDGDFLPSNYLTFLFGITLTHSTVEMISIFILFENVCDEISELLLSKVVNISSRFEYMSTELDNHKSNEENYRYRTREANGRVQLLLLKELEASVYEMGRLSFRISEVFFLWITAWVCICSFGCIPILFLIVSGYFETIWTVYFTVASLLSIAFFAFYVGQSFKEKVNSANQLISGMNLWTSDYVIKAQISYLVVFLEKFERINMRGWYNLDYASLLSLASQTVTYLVIIFQVGWTPVTALLTNSSNKL